MKECGLISLYREVIMGLAPDYVAGDILLSQKGIGGDVSTFNVDSVEEGIAVLISFVCLNSSSPAMGREPTFFGCSTSSSRDRRHS